MNNQIGILVFLLPSLYCILKKKMLYNTQRFLAYNTVRNIYNKLHNKICDKT